MKWISLALLACSLPCNAGPATQPIQIKPGTVIEYRGDIDSLPIGLTLRVGGDSTTVDGCYFYDKYCKDIRIKGKIDGRVIRIQEYDGEKATASFVGEFPVTDPQHRFRGELQAEVIVGHWSGGPKRLPFRLTATYSGSWQRGERYLAAGFDDEKVVDDFISRFRQSVLDDDVGRVASMLRYPVRVLIHGKHVTIRDAESLRREYDRIFRPPFVDRIRMSPPCHLFARDQGVMLGNGEVWVAPVDKRPAVVALNNQLDP